MDFRLIEYFVAVAEHGSVTRASQALFIAQPSLSQAIRSLERQVGVQLFDRTGRQMALTAEGVALSVTARRILADIEVARAKVRDVTMLNTGRLDISTHSSLCIHPLADLVSQFHAAYPGVLVNVLDSAAPSEVVNHVRRGQAELGFTLWPIVGDALKQYEYDEQEIAIVLPARLAEQLPDPVPLLALSDVPMIVESADLRSRSMLSDAMSDEAPGIVVESGYPQTIRELVSLGVGATFIPRAVAEAEALTAADDVVVRSTSPQITRSIGFVWRAGELSPAAQGFLALARASRALLQNA